MHMISLNCYNCCQYQIRWIVDDKVVGSCSCLMYKNNKAKVMLIDDVFVEEEHRGKGYGKAMINGAIELAQRHDVDSVELTVNMNNVIARNLYRVTGFEETDKKYCRRILRVL